MAALPRKRTNSGNGSSPATLAATRSRSGSARASAAVEPGGQRLAPARLAVRDVAGEAARVARAERAPSPAVAMIALDAQAARAGDESSYSSVSRRRARNSVLSTAGRLMPMRSPISR